MQQATEPITVCPSSSILHACATIRMGPANPVDYVEGVPCWTPRQVDRPAPGETPAAEASGQHAAALGGFVPGQQWDDLPENLPQFLHVIELGTGDGGAGLGRNRGCSCSAAIDSNGAHRGRAHGASRTARACQTRPRRRKASSGAVGCPAQLVRVAGPKQSRFSEAQITSGCTRTARTPPMSRETLVARRQHEHIGHSQHSRR